MVTLEDSQLSVRIILSSTIPIFTTTISVKLLMGLPKTNHYKIINIQLYENVM